MNAAQATQATGRPSADNPLGQSEVSRQKGQLRQNLDALHGAIEILEKRLDQVVQPAVPDAPPHGEAPKAIRAAMQSELGSELQDLGDSVAKACNRIDGIVSRLCL